MVIRYVFLSRRCYGIVTAVSTIIELMRYFFMNWDYSFLLGSTKHPLLHSQHSEINFAYDGWTASTQRMVSCCELSILISSPVTAVRGYLTAYHRLIALTLMSGLRRRLSNRIKFIHLVKGLNAAA